MDTRTKIMEDLVSLNLSNSEAAVYVELITSPNTHLQLSRNTGINRTKIYRIVEQLEKRSLVLRRTDERGVFLIANDPSALEIEVIAQEEKVKRQREDLSKVISNLEQVSQDQRSLFTVRTYEGAEGFRQMQWHELKAKDEVLVFGNVTTEELTGSRGWAERFRALCVDAGYKTRELINVPYETPSFTDNQAFMDLYDARVIPKEALPASTPMIIYNDTVAVYQFDKEKRVGVEIVNAAYAQTMRYIFEHYWNLNDVQIQGK